VRDADNLAAWLQQCGIDARAYHAGLQHEERLQLEDMLLANEVKALVATVALGMGFDEPDLGFVVHFQRPGSVVHYYQQVGRAGRAIDHAHGVLIPAPKMTRSLTISFAQHSLRPRKSPRSCARSKPHLGR
jgi:ATP-dependent DNA helicase RecQ